MSHLMRAEDVTVGTRLRYLGRAYVPVSFTPHVGAEGLTGRVAVDGEGREFVLHDGFTVWAMEDQS